MSEGKKYANWSKEELIREVLALKKQKTYGLVWEREKTKEEFDLFINWEGEKTKEEFGAESKDKFPVLAEVRDKEISTDEEKPVNLLIEGDNYHALAVLNFTHKGAIDVIYIDPPYNTGNKSWKYNNQYVEKDDAYKHSKWLSFMSKRLSLAKYLLKNSGIIIVTIDDYEVHQLGLLMDDIFGENNRIATVIVENKPSGRTSDTFFATSHEYYFFYAKDITKAEVFDFDLPEEQSKLYNFSDDSGSFKYRDFLRTGGYSTPEERPNSYYPVYYNPKSKEIVLEKTRDFIEILPIDSSGRKRVWRRTKPSLIAAYENGEILVKEYKGKYKILIKDRIKEGMKPKTIWKDSKYDASSHGTKLLQKILSEPKPFDYPKSLWAVYDALLILLKDKPNAIILDFFAGSGTTGHAVLELNKQLEGNRSFILCTNNEDNNGSGGRICTDVCYPRIQKVMKGYTAADKDEIKGLGGNLKYFKTDFVEAAPTDKNKRKLVDKCTEMLCIKENAFDKVKDGKKWKVFKNKNYHLGIIFDDEYIEDFVKEAEKISGKIHVYVFSHDDSVPTKEFKAIKNRVILCPIPEAILKVYRKVFKND